LYGYPFIGGTKEDYEDKLRDLKRMYGRPATGTDNSKKQRPAKRGVVATLISIITMH
jgi:hypothetical protein